MSKEVKLSELEAKKGLPIKQITVAELIELLKQQPQNSEIYCEGHDGLEEINSVYQRNEYVVIGIRTFP